MHTLFASIQPAGGRQAWMAFLRASHWRAIFLKAAKFGDAYQCTRFSLRSSPQVAGRQGMAFLRASHRRAIFLKAAKFGDAYQCTRFSLLNSINKKIFYLFIYYITTQKIRISWFHTLGRSRREDQGIV